MEEQDQLIIDMYKKYADKGISRSDISTVKELYGEDIDAMINDIHLKYKGKPLNTGDIEKIKGLYDLSTNNTQSQSSIKEPDIISPEPTSPTAQTVNPFLSGEIDQQAQPRIEEPPTYGYQGAQIDRDKAMDIVSNASETGQMEGLNVSNDPEVLDGMKRKLAELKGETETIDPTEEKVKVNPVMSFLNIFSKTIANTPADILEAWAIASAFTERQLANVPVIGKPANKELKASDIGTFKIADDWRKFTEELYPVNEGDEQTFGGGVVAGLGQIVPMVLTGGQSGTAQLVKTALIKGTKLTPYIKAGKEVLSRVGSKQGLIGGSQMAAPMYKEAIESGATEDEALQYAIENFIVGSVMESLPVQSMFSRIKKIEPGAKILSVVKDGAVGFTEEAVTEMWQATFANMSAQRIYDFNREILDGVGEEGAIGGTVGFLMNTAMSALTKRRGNFSGANKDIIDKSIKELESKIKSIDQNNESLKESVENLENTSVITLQVNESEMDFIEMPDGTIEAVEEGMSEAEANSKVDALSEKYPNMEFSIVDNTNKSDPYAETGYFVVAKKKEAKKESVENLENTSVKKLQVNESEMDFIENPDGTIEAVEEGMSEAEANSKVDALSEKYPNMEFSIVDNTNKSDPYAETDYSVVAKKKEITKEDEPIIEPENEAKPADSQDGEGKELPVNENGGEKSDVEGVSEQVQVDKPSDEQQYEEAINGDLVTFTYNKEDEIPDVFKDRVSSRGTNDKGEEIIRVTVPKSLADYELKNQEKQEVKQSKQSKDEQIPEPEVPQKEPKEKVKIEIIPEKTEEVIPEETKIEKEDARPKIGFTLFGEFIEGRLNEDGSVESPDRGRYPAAMVDNIVELTDSKNTKTEKTQPKKKDLSKKSKEIKEEITNLFSDFFDAGKNNLTSGGVSPDQLAIAGKIIVKAGKLGINTFEQLVEWIRDNIGSEKLIENFDAIKSSYIYNLSKSNPNNESIEGISKFRLSETKKDTKGIPLKSRKKEAKPLSIKQQIKESTEGKPSKEKDTSVNEYNEMKKDLRSRVKAAKEGFKEGVKVASKKAKDKSDKVQAMKNIVTKFVKDDIKDTPLDDFTKSEINKIVTELNKAKTERSVNKAIDAIFDVIAKSGTRKRLKGARSKIATAKNNVKKGRIGTLSPNSPLDRMLKLNPKIVPNEVFNEYESILNEIGERKSNLNLSEKALLNTRVNKVMDAISDQNSRVSDLALTYEGFDNKQYTKSGKESFEKTVDQMVKDGEIDQEDADFMKLMKDDIFSPEVSSTPDQDIAEARRETLSKKNALDVKGSNQYEYSIIKFLKSITPSDLDSLSYREIQHLGQIIDNVSNGFYTHSAENMRQKVEGVRSGKKIKDVIFDAKSRWMDFISATKAGIKNAISPGSTSTIKEKVKRNPTPYIDQTIGNFKNTSVYRSTFRKIGRAFSSFEQEVNTITERLIKAESLIPESKQFEVRAKLMMIAVQREFMSTPDGKTHSAKEWMDATVEDKDSIYTKESKDKIESIFNESATEGEFDLKKAIASLSQDEKKVLKILEGVNNGLKPKADHTATIIRGNRVPIYENYIHVPLAVKGGLREGPDIKELNRTGVRVSTKGGSLIERSGKAHAISFDIFDNVISGARKTLLDYHMTPADREVKKTMSYLKKEASTESEIDNVASINGVYNEVMESVFADILGNKHLLDQISEEAIRKGYQSMLGGLGRSASEMTSNAVFAMIYKGDETMRGIEMAGEMSLSDMSKAATNLGTTQSTRLFDYTGMSGKHIDFSGSSMKEINKVTSYNETIKELLSKLKNDPTYKLSDNIGPILQKKAGQAFKGVKDNAVYKTVDNIQSFLLSKPDQLIARPMWFGSFSTEFEKITGKKPDMDKIANNDLDYMNDNSDALNESVAVADDVMIEAVASSNPFDGIPRNHIGRSKNWITPFYKAFNGFMTKFPTYEYNSALRATYSLVDNGMLSKPDAIKLLAALSARLVTYSVMTGTLLNFAYRGIVSVLGYEMEDEEEQSLASKEYWTKQALTIVAMLSVNRNLGNFSKVPINYAVEKLNKKYGEGITYEGDYDGFGDNIVYPLIPIEQTSSKSVFQASLENASGPLSPLVKTVARAGTAIKRATDEKSKETTREKYRNELLHRTPLEVFGNMGYIPFYKDIRAIQLKIMYETMEKADKVSKDAYTPSINIGTKKKE